MHTLPNQADHRFLRNILFVLVISTIVTGGIATYTAVVAGQHNTVTAALAER